MAEISKMIGGRIRSYRIKAGLNQEQLAEKAGVHDKYIGQLERGEKNATLVSIEKVARALNVSFETLFENIIVGDTKNEIASKCYELIAALSQKEQQAIYDLIGKIIDYKKL